MEDALVKALIMTADEDKILSAVGIFLDNALFERASARAHRNNAGVGQLLLRLADGSHHRLRLQNHAGTAAEGRIIHRAMHVMRKIARIDAAHLNQALGGSALQNAVACSLLNLFGK